MQREKVFTRTRKQRRVALTAGPAFGVAGLVVLTLWHGVSTTTSAELTLLGVLLVLLGGLVVVRSADHTRIDEQGLHTRTPWKRRNLRWADITGIDRIAFAAGGSAVSVRTIKLQVTTADGGRFKLPAPFTTDWATTDPDFEAKLREIRQAWHSGSTASA
jgi:hypothetical protein